MFVKVNNEKHQVEIGDLICRLNWADLKQFDLVIGKHIAGVRCFNINEGSFFIWNGANYKLDGFKIIK